MKNVNLKKPVISAEEYLLSQGLPEEKISNLPWFDFGNVSTWLENYSEIASKQKSDMLLEVKAMLEDGDAGRSEIINAIQSFLDRFNNF